MVSLCRMAVCGALLLQGKQGQSQTIRHFPRNSRRPFGCIVFKHYDFGLWCCEVFERLRSRHDAYAMKLFENKQISIT